MSEVSLKKRWVLPSGLLLLKGHLWRWLVLFVPMCAGMFVAQRSLFPRPGDGWKKSALIWLDKQAVNLYSRAKVRFGFSDEFASRLLRVISKKG